MSRLAEIGAKIFHPKSEFRPKILSTQKRVRGVLDGQYIFDTIRAKLVWESYFPSYWIPASDFKEELVNFTEDAPVSGIQSSTSKLSVRNGSKSVPALLIPDSFNSELAGYVKIEFGDLETWYEELQPVLDHPKDPFHRVDIIPSGRKVRIEINGTVIADTGSDGGVMSLWETNIPGRWYLPQTAIKWQYLKPSQTHTSCPYKGQASYYNAVIDGKEYKDVVWWYPGPTYESAAIRDMLCFYPDKVKTFVDDQPLEKLGQQAPAKEKKDSNTHVHSSCNC